MPEFSMPIEHSKNFDLRVRNNEDIVLVLLLRKVELCIERLKATTFLALEFYLLLHKYSFIFLSTLKML